MYNWHNKNESQEGYSYAATNLNNKRKSQQGDICNSHNKQEWGWHGEPTQQRRKPWGVGGWHVQLTPQEECQKGDSQVPLTPQKRKPGGWQRLTTYTTRKKARRVTNMYNLHNKEECLGGDMYNLHHKEESQEGDKDIQLTQQRRKPEGWQTCTTYITRKKARMVKIIYNLHNKEESQMGDKHVQLTQQGRKPGGWQTRTTYTTRKNASWMTNMCNLHNKEEGQEGDHGSHDEGETWEEVQCLWIDGVEQQCSQHCNKTLWCRHQAKQTTCHRFTVINSQPVTITVQIVELSQVNLLQVHTTTVHTWAVIKRSTCHRYTVISSQPVTIAVDLSHRYILTTSWSITVTNINNRPVKGTHNNGQPVTGTHNNGQPVTGTHNSKPVTGTHNSHPVESTEQQLSCHRYTPVHTTIDLSQVHTTTVNLSQVHKTTGQPTPGGTHNNSQPVTGTHNSWPVTRNMFTQQLTYRRYMQQVNLSQVHTTTVNLSQIHTTTVNLSQVHTTANLSQIHTSQPVTRTHNSWPVTGTCSHNSWPVNGAHTNSKPVPGTHNNNIHLYSQAVIQVHTLKSIRTSHRYTIAHEQSTIILVDTSIQTLSTLHSWLVKRYKNTVNTTQLNCHMGI